MRLCVWGELNGVIFEPRVGEQTVPELSDWLRHCNF